METIGTSGTSPAAEPESFSRRAWLLLNTAAAIAAGAGLFVTDAYQRVLVLDTWIALAFLVGLPAAGFYARRFREEKRPVAATWATFAAVALLIIGAKSIFDAHEFHYNNCWLLSGDEGGASTWECVPGKSEPQQWPSSEESDGRYCYQVNTSSSGGTIWRCE